MNDGRIASGVSVLTVYCALVTTVLLMVTGIFTVQLHFFVFVELKLFRLVQMTAVYVM